MPDQNRRRAPYVRSRRSWKYKEILGYMYPEKSLDYIRELEQRRIQNQEDDVSWLNDIFAIR